MKRYIGKFDSKEKKRKRKEIKVPYNGKEKNSLLREKFFSQVSVWEIVQV